MPPYPLSFCLACGKPSASAVSVLDGRQAETMYECSKCSAFWSLVAFTPGRVAL